ncbi:MAG: hypothetical protein NC187_08510 [Candidatus Amulumruptor caecigallinarius]|nr:hypothetical protein [Candidatus Amulumruptor caecigallinarius]MCM1397510.1 hypothetical protein [Candidatus Amulumruptor caecigallinarius]MCM1454412.1 hypothetical protein [bacterium]
MKRTDYTSRFTRRAGALAILAGSVALSGCGPMSDGYISVGDSGYYGSGYTWPSIATGYWPDTGYWPGGTYWPGGYWPGNSLPSTPPNPRPPRPQPGIGGGPNIPSGGPNIPSGAISRPTPLPGNQPVGGGGGAPNIPGGGSPGRPGRPNH